MKDGHRVDDANTGNVERDAGARELGGEHLDIEASDVESTDVATIEQLGELRRDLGERRLTGHVVVSHPVDARGLGGNRTTGKHETRPARRIAVGMNDDDGDLDDA